ncbi:MerR family transcriptional regulator [Sphingopyxis sp. KK2]|uniref:MerR family transcriptional regulator n=1 Tax=Sphingopyxis sp. KK2 TaxID=1855727 RepID=UPI00097E6A9D|nr:MerR family transcriptional regulator [Sphingopyxis sp. KK2]
MTQEVSFPAVTIAKAAELSGLKQHMITYLGRIDVMKPSGASGRGRTRRYTFNDVLFLRVIAELLRRGIEVKRLGAALRRAKEEADAWEDIRSAPGHFLVTDGTDVYLRRKGRLESKNVDGQFAFAFVLDLAYAHGPLTDDWPRNEASN